MTRWSRVRALFEETVDLAPDARARVLADRTLADADVAHEVASLLAAADDEGPSALDGHAAGLLAGLRDEPPAEALCGTTAGACTLHEHVGSGGSAHVYRATRESAGVSRRVAVKVLRAQLDGGAFLERFERERHTLAALEHEHVVSFLDAGALPDGRPFLVMEFVDGEPLPRAAAGLPLRERVRLALPVLDAVDYAHGRGLVHRDIKPSNVLVGPRGSPRLLDFGVATALASAGGEARSVQPFTPGYASPEQLRGEPVSAASDLYALGLLLHETFVGALPPRGAGVAPEPRDVGAGLPADLAAVLRRALAAEPDARYPSAAALADDLRRWLAHEPVHARRGGRAYRVARFLRRRRAPVALGAAAALILALGWMNADLDRRLAEADASRGWRAHVEARVLAGVLEGWIRDTAAADPALRASAVAHLEDAVAGRLADFPEAETLARLTLADLHLADGDLERAAREAERAFDLAQTTPGVGAAGRERAAALRATVRDALRATVRDALRDAGPAAGRLAR